MKQATCPCGSNSSYTQCCEKHHKGKIASTAEELMRSRYSAYHFELESYLLNTWHNSTRPNKILFEKSIKWTRLKIIDLKEITKKESTVHFIATYKENGKANKLEEISLFQLIDNQWYYLSTPIKNPNYQTFKNNLN